MLSLAEEIATMFPSSFPPNSRHNVNIWVQEGVKIYFVFMRYWLANMRYKLLYKRLLVQWPDVLSWPRVKHFDPS